MRPNPLRARFERGESVLNAWLTLPSAVSAEAMAHAGFDSVTVDLQHGPIGFETALAMLQAMTAAPAVPLVRVAWNEPAAVMRALDAGAYGVICPMIDDADACRRFVAACRYPPAGVRSWGPIRAQLEHGRYEPAAANGQVLAFAMIETARALENLDAILATPGLDGIYVGPSDLSQSLGGSVAVDFAWPPLARAVARVEAACRERRVVAGIHTTQLEDARALRAAGYRFVTVGSDLGYLAAGAAQVVAGLR